MCAVVVVVNNTCVFIVVRAHTHHTHTNIEKRTQDGHVAHSVCTAGQTKLDFRFFVFFFFRNLGFVAAAMYLCVLCCVS